MGVADATRIRALVLNPLFQPNIARPRPLGRTSASRTDANGENRTVAAVILKWTTTHCRRSIPAHDGAMTATPLPTQKWPRPIRLIAYAVLAGLRAIEFARLQRLNGLLERIEETMAIDRDFGC